MPRLRSHQLAKLTEPQRYNLLDAMRDKLRELLDTGDFDGNPDEWLPAAEIVALAYAPGTNNTLKFMCLKTAADLVHVPAAAQLRIDAQGNAQDVNVTVLVAPWAANKQADEVVERPAIAIESSRTHAADE